MGSVALHLPASVLPFLPCHTSSCPVLQGSVPRSQMPLKTSALLPKAGTASERGKSGFLCSARRKSVSARRGSGVLRVSVHGVPAQPPLPALVPSPVVSPCLQQLQQGDGELLNIAGKMCGGVFFFCLALCGPGVLAGCLLSCFFFFSSPSYLAFLQPPRSAVHGQVRVSSF